MILVSLAAAYLIGSVPMGYVVVKRLTGQDVTKIGSGRTGGTNAMRAAGFFAGLLTALLDMGKGFSSIWLAQRLAPGNEWLAAAAAVACVAGHNWSVWLYALYGRFSGGAGTAPNVGAAAAFWPPIFLILVPTGFALLFGIGYASLASLIVAAMIPTILGVRAAQGLPGAGWPQVAYGVGTFLLTAWALRPNIRRLLSGTERLVGWRARRQGAGR